MIFFFDYGTLYISEIQKRNGQKAASAPPTKKSDLGITKSFKGITLMTIAAKVHNALFFIVSNLHHHHIALVARISLTLSRHSSLSFIALGRSSGQHPQQYPTLSREYSPEKS